jgi:hypothetical protein
MRRICLLLVMALGSLAWAAGAQTGGSTARLPAGSPAPALAASQNLVQADRAGASSTPASRPWSYSSQPGLEDRQACRLTCAQNYYFCSATTATPDCPGAWSQCAAGCDLDDLTSGASAPGR